MENKERKIYASGLVAKIIERVDEQKKYKCEICHSDGTIVLFAERAGDFVVLCSSHAAEIMIAMHDVKNAKDAVERWKNMRND